MTQKGFEDGWLRLPQDRVRKIFEPIVKRVLGLIEGQFNAVHAKKEQVSAILLGRSSVYRMQHKTFANRYAVGGFATSEYLLQRVRQHFAHLNPAPSGASTANTGQPITVMQPPNAWTAVTRGAIIKSLEGGLVSARCSRFNYGAPYSAKLDEAIHPKSHKIWDDFEGIDRVHSAMRWYVNKSKLIGDKQAIKMAYHRTFLDEKFPAKDKDKLMVSDELWADDSDKQAVMLNQKSMFKVCRLTNKLSKIPEHLWKKRANKLGAPFWQIDFVLEMRIDSASMEFCMKVDGEKYGSVVAEFNNSALDARG